MRHLSQTGRTMLEIISVMGIIGVLSITGVHMYQKASNTLLADGIIKDVLTRANQAKGNDDLNRTGRTKKMVYTPEYLKKTKQTRNVGGEVVEGYQYDTAVKGRYGFSYVIVDMSHSGFSEDIRALTKFQGGRQYAVVKLTGKPMTPGVCNSLRGKLKTLENNRPKVICITPSEPQVNNIKNDCENNANNYVSRGCFNAPRSDLYFTIEY